MLTGTVARRIFAPGANSEKRFWDAALRAELRDLMHELKSKTAMTVTESVVARGIKNIAIQTNANTLKQLSPSAEAAKANRFKNALASLDSAARKAKEVKSEGFGKQDAKI